MVDVLTPEQRSRCMAAIKGKHTKPELLVRALLRQTGLRYQLHRKNLSGKPDLVIPKTKTAVFVHGCFWHMHRCRYGRVVPATNAEFWQNKRQGNVTRDKRNRAELRKQGWKIVTLWECWTRKPEELLNRATKLLNIEK
jgi:DNA mismatch endonuclease, patch repair protein